jgi:ring-1,2-phenylacetyl-CoA epoxidase subunit PaaD
LLREVQDPEVPVLSVIDLGIVRDVKIKEDEVEVVITPTYSGCPAMDVIKAGIGKVLFRHGYTRSRVTTVLSPAWTTDWMSGEGKDKLKAFGIAPPTPLQQVCHTRLFHDAEAIQCPRCNSFDTRLISQFGSTACKALYQCNDCHEPFDYFKCH